MNILKPLNIATPFTVASYPFIYGYYPPLERIADGNVPHRIRDDNRPERLRADSASTRLRGG